MELLEIYTADCHIYKQYKPTSPKPAVENLLHQIVSINLKQHKDRWIT